MGLRVEFKTELLVDELVETFAQGVGNDQRGDSCGVERCLNSVTQMVALLAGHLTIGIEAVLFVLQGHEIKQQAGGVLSDEEHIALIIYIDIISAIRQAVENGTKLGVITPKFLVVLHPQPVLLVCIDVVSSPIPSQWYRGRAVLLNALAGLPVPEINATWGGGNNPSIVQLQDVQDAVVAESVGCIDRGKHELLCPTNDGAQQHDDI